MPGPLMHVASMQRCGSLLASLDLSLIIGSKIEVMEPDFHGSHGWDFSTSDSGSLINNMNEQYAKIKKILVSARGGVLDLTNFSREVRYLCHYATDAHTIGQISAEFWGKKDDIFDAASEMVLNKGLYPVSFITCSSISDLETTIHTTMKSVYDTYKIMAKKWYFPVSNNLITMARNAVKLGAEAAASYVRFALEESTKNV